LEGQKAQLSLENLTQFKLLAGRRFCLVTLVRMKSTKFVAKMKLLHERCAKQPAVS